MACSAKARISLMALGARFLKLTPWHYISGKEVTISLPPECHLQEKTLRDECLWSFGHSGLHKTNSSFVFRVRMCGCEPKTFSRPSSRSLSVTTDKSTIALFRFLCRSWHGLVVWHWGVGFPYIPDAHIPHTFFSVTNSMLQEKFLVLCPLCLQNSSYIRIVAGRLGKGGIQHTRLCRLMVYSRDTTSAIAERLLPVLTLDISAEEVRGEN